MSRAEIVDPRKRLRAEITLAKESIYPGEEAPFLARLIGLIGMRNSIALSVALDISPSMDGGKLFYAKHSLIQALDVLGPGDFLYILGFCGRTYPIYGPKIIETSEDLMEAKRRIAEVKLCPKTNLGEALAKLMRVLHDLPGEDFVPCALLLTDGQPTVGERDPLKLIDILIKARGELDAPVIAIGVGRDYNEGLLLEIAEKTNGKFEHISDLLDLEKVVLNEVLKAAQVAAKNVQFLIEHPEGIEVDVYGRRIKKEGEALRVDLGYLSSGDVEDIVGAIKVPPVYPRSNAQIRFRLRYIDASEGIVVESQSAMLTLNVGKAPSTVNQAVIQKVELVRTIEKLKAAIKERDYARAIAYLRSVAEKTVSLGDLNLKERTMDIIELLEKGEFEEAAKRAASLASKASRGKGV
ncbi:MAG: VWA domain-containing protein [Desulfurococcales archaeon]|nr:VWA domain-containing protein [Desulfurococcales archaeon]